MTPDELYACALDAALQLPGAEVVAFAETWESFKVAGKWFGLTGWRNGDRIVTLKADPADVLAACQANPAITPGYHMNKKHWLTIAATGGIDADLVRSLVLESYLIVVASLPRNRQPVNPEEYTEWAWGIVPPPT